LPYGVLSGLIRTQRLMLNPKDRRPRTSEGYVRAFIPLARVAFAQSRGAPRVVLETLSKDEDRSVLEALLANPELPPALAETARARLKGLQG
jgi:hypothetical protein